jgi:integrase
MVKPHGTVTLEECNGSIRLYFSYKGKYFRFYPGLSATVPINWSIAQGKAEQIYIDLVTDNFDSSLNKYRLKRHKKYLSTTAPTLFDQFREFKSQELNERTLKKYDTITNDLERGLDIAAASVTLDRAKEFVAATWTQRIQPDTIKHRLFLLKACWNWGMEEGKIDFSRNPWGGIKLRVPHSQGENPFTKEEVQQIIQGAREFYPYYADFIDFLFYSGVRVGEAIALKWKHFASPDDCTIVCIRESWSLSGYAKETKGRDLRYIKMSERMAGVLCDRQPHSWEPDDFLFPNCDGGALNVHNLRQRVWLPLLKQLGIKHRTLKNCRKTMISHALDQGIPGTTLALITGNDIQTLYRYYAGSVRQMTPMPDLLEIDFE